jgi:hypothetical protein
MDAQIVMGHPGPFGLYVVKDIDKVYYEESGAPPKPLTNRINRNELGVKTFKKFLYLSLSILRKYFI